MITSSGIILTAHSSQLTAHSSQLTAHSSQLTAHSSQLTAHSSQLELYLDGFLSNFHKYDNLFSLYTQKQTADIKPFAISAYLAVALRTETAKYVPYSQDSAILVPTQLLIMNYEFIINYKFHSALYRNSRQAVWFDSS
ncbi:hypothetical protein [Treponema medium]|uniref:Uncharacterized protein n=3 Tax=Treponema medium TaxID=58231 RepID=A0ABX7LXQ8_TREMD|nr:hypothetical protein [Treponema medium]QSH96823.1 hypothetical protein DWB79_03420 [Treponema medium]